FFVHPSPSQFYTLSLHDALPISRAQARPPASSASAPSSVPKTSVRTAPDLSASSQKAVSLAENGRCKEALPLLKIASQERSDKEDRKSTRLNSSHVEISYAVFCL